MPVRKWGGERVIGTTDIAAGAKEADVAGLADGGYVVVWEDSSVPKHVLAQRFDGQGNPVGAQIQVGNALDPAGTSFSGPQVAALADGGFAVAYTSSAGNNNAWVNIYQADGTLQGSTANSSADFSESQGAITAFGTGSRWVFQAGDDIKIGFQTVNSDMTAGVQKEPSIAEIGYNRYAVTWIDQNGGISIRYRVFESNGTAVTASIQVNNTSNVVDATAASIIGLADGRFVIAWGEASAALQDQQGYSVHAQIYDADGVQQGAEFVINSAFKNLQVFPDLVALPDGGFVAVWSDSSAGVNAGDYNIAGQVFDAFGQRVGGQFTVNTGTDGADGQFFPHVAALADGRLVVEWHSFATGEIRTQIIDPRDGVVTGTDDANTLYGHALVADEINGFGGDDALSGLGGDDGLYGGDGNDVLRGGTGADELYGDNGIDTASYLGSLAGVEVDLLTGLGSFGEAQGDTLAGIENLSGSLQADGLRGDAGANTLQGLNGNDILNGRDGSDVLNGGAGADSLDGGNGIDTASYFTAPTGVAVNLYAGTASGGEAQGDVLSGIENLSGSHQGDDNLVGDSGVNVLQGWNGDDVLTGARGADMLTGGAGADRFLYIDVVHSPVGTGADRITDFSHAQGDSIELFAIDANTTVAGDQAFSFIGTGLYTGVAGQLRYASDGAVTTIAGDVNGDSVSDFHIRLTGSIPLVAGDFAL
jgi:Ca2+-binding RTX toxin-like protein